MQTFRNFSSGEGVRAGEHDEGYMTRQIESYTSAVPSGTYLSIGIAAIAGALMLQLAGRKEDANFVSQWVPTVLIMGLYNKLVKLQGSD